MPSSSPPQTASTASSVAAAGEDRQAREQPPLRLVEQVVAPGDRVAQRLLARRAGRARRRSAAPSRLAEPRAGSPAGGSSLTRAAASSIASGRPSSRAQISATAGAFSSVSAKSGSHRPRALDEQRAPPRTATALESAAARSGRAAPAAAPAYSCSPVDAQRRAAGRPALQAWRRRASSSADQRRGRQRPARSCRAPAAPAGRAGGRCSRSQRRGSPGSRTPSACAIAGGHQVAGRRSAPRATKKTPSRKSSEQLGGDLQRQAGLAGAAGAGQRQQRASRSRSSSRTSASSRSRPTKRGQPAAGRLLGRRRACAAAGSRPAGRAITSWKTRSGRPGP